MAVQACMETVRPSIDAGVGLLTPLQDSISAVGLIPMLLSGRRRNSLSVPSMYLELLSLQRNSTTSSKNRPAQTHCIKNTGLGKLAQVLSLNQLCECPSPISCLAMLLRLASFHLSAKTVHWFLSFCTSPCLPCTHLVWP